MTLAGFRGAIFDMDGTLLDSMPQWRLQNRYFAERNNVEIPEEIAARLMETSSYEAATIYAARYPHLCMDRDAIVADYERHLDPLYRTVVEPKKGLMPFLEMLKERGVRMCVATATPADIARRALEHHGVAPYMEFIVSGPEVGLSKSSPAYFPRVAQMLGVDKDEAVVFEDAAYAIRSAAAAGMRVFAIEDEAARAGREEIIRLSTVFRSDYITMLPVVEAMFRADRACSLH